MKRTLDDLAGRTHDLVIVGAGMFGCAAAWEAARRGLSVALIDSGDFGHSTSSNSLKIIHGGFRYLQHADLRRMRESIRARRRFLHLAPHLITPLRCMVPTFGSGIRSRPLMAIALAMNDLISVDRNSGVHPARQLGRGRLISRRDFSEIVPAQNGASFTGAAQWFDALAHNTERLTLTFALSAAQLGATAANYVQAVHLVERDGRACGVAARDMLSGCTFEIPARTVLVAAGPWAFSLLKNWGIDAPAPPPLTRAINLVLRRRLFGDTAVGLEGRNADDGKKRNYFFVPWREGTLVGTMYKPFLAAPDDAAVTTDDVAEFIQDIHRLVPSLNLVPDDVAFTHVGILPAEPVETGLASEPAKHPRLLTPKGRAVYVCQSVKYTTALTDAETMVAAIANDLGKSVVPEEQPVYGGESLLSPGDFHDAAGLSPETLQHLCDTYGTASRAVVDLVRSDPELAGQITHDQRTIAAEIVYAIREEMAVTLSDVVLRRTTLGSFRFPGRAALDRCAGIMGAELGWGEATQADMVANTVDFYRMRRAIPV